MRTMNYLGALAALVAVGTASWVARPFYDAQPPVRRRNPHREQVPNDFGPVVDTAKESKRAKRRRLAKQQELDK
jgi:hypothetical protein